MGVYAELLPMIVATEVSCKSLKVACVMYNLHRVVVISSIRYKKKHLQKKK